MTQPFRRLTFYLPGFDPIPPRRYRELYRREAAEQARIAGYRIEVTGGLRQKGRFGWRTQALIGDRPALQELQVLIWADLIQRESRAGIPGTYLALLRTAWTYLASGTLWRVARLRRGPTIAALYPVVVLLVQLAAAVAIAGLGAWALSAAGLPGWATIPPALALIWAVLVGFRRLDHRIFAYYLMNDYAYTARLAGAYPPALEDRIARFRDRLAGAMAEDVDEVLVVGHSSGAYLGVSVLADLLRAGLPPPGPGGSRPALSLLTLGHVVPMASFLPRADRLRADLGFLAGRDELFWVDVTAPGDACCFALCDPVAVNGVAPPDPHQPLVISAAFTQTLSPERRRMMKYRWFRRHFQYLCAFDDPRNYDYFAITGGAQTLAQRFAGRAHSPGRITRAVGRRP